MNIISDSPEIKPLLNFDKYASSLVEILRTQRNISLGIFGDWGTGKTTLMKSIEAQITENVIDLKHPGRIDIIKILSFLERRYSLIWKEEEVTTTSEEKLFRISHSKDHREAVFRIAAEGKDAEGRGKISKLLGTLKMIGREVMEENEIIKNYLPGVKDIILEIDGKEEGDFIAYADSNDRTMLYLNLENDCIITCWFNPWKHETDEDNISAALLKRIAFSIVEHPAFSPLKPLLIEITKKFFGKLSKGLMDKAASYISTDPKFVQSIQDEIYTVAFDSEKKSIYYDGGLILEKHIDRIRKIYPSCNIVVFIDDLDRCSIKTVHELFESIKAVMDLEGFSYVIGLSETLVEQVLREGYKQVGFSESQSKMLPQQYLNKIITIGYRLQDYSLGSISELLDYYLMEINDPQFTNQMSEYREFMINSCHRNPRELKRLLNFMRIYSPGFSKSTNMPDAVALPVIIFFHSWNSCYKRLTSEEEFRAVFYNLLRLHVEDIGILLETSKSEGIQANSQSYNHYYIFLKKIRDEFAGLDEESRNSLISIPQELWTYFAKRRMELKGIPWEEFSPHFMKTDEKERPKTDTFKVGNLEQALTNNFDKYLFVDKKYFSALRISNELISLNPQNALYYNWRALALVAIGEFEGAIENYRMAFKKARIPLYIVNEAYTHSQLAEIDSSNKERHVLNAIECYKMTIEIEPTRAVEMNCWIAQNYIGIGDLQSSLNYYNEALRIDPNNTQALSGLGSVYLAKMQYDEAISKFNEILQRDASVMDKSIAYTNLAWSYDGKFYAEGLDLRNITTAKRYLKKANELNPQNMEILRYLEKLNQSFPNA